MDAAGASGMLHTVQPECYDSPVQLEARPIRACRAGSQAASMAAEVHRTAIGCPASEASCRQWDLRFTPVKLRLASARKAWPQSLRHGQHPGEAQRDNKADNPVRELITGLPAASA